MCKVKDLPSRLKEELKKVEVKMKEHKKSA